MINAVDHSPVRTQPCEPVAADLAPDELAGRLEEHVLAGALARKSNAERVPFPVWWRVSDALRAAVHGPRTQAIEATEQALAAVAEVSGDRALATPRVTALSEEPARSLRRAQLLVARLVFTSAPTSPTLLQVRLARLRRALLAAA